MLRRRSSPTTSGILAGFALVLALAVGCRVTFISPYDQVLDQDVSSLQQTTEAFLTQLSNEVGTPAAAYSSNTDFYVKAQAAIATMETRATAAGPKSRQIATELSALQQTFTDMQKLHQLNGAQGLTAANLSNTKSALESEFSSIITLELALKNASTPPAPALAPAKTQ